MELLKRESKHNEGDWLSLKEGSGAAMRGGPKEYLQEVSGTSVVSDGRSSASYFDDFFRPNAVGAGTSYSPSPGTGAVVWQLGVATDRSSIAFFSGQALIESEKPDHTAEDRIALLSSKYATKKHDLSVEDEARLQILNAEIDIETPRYKEADWAVLDEARALLAELEEG